MSKKHILKRFEDHVIQMQPTDTKKAVQNVVLKNVDITLLIKLYDIVNRYALTSPMKDRIFLTPEEKMSLLTTAFCHVVDKEKYKKAIDDAVEEARLNGRYKELLNCRKLIACCFSIAFLLKCDPIKAIKQATFIDTLCKVFKEYEIHFEDCELLAAHFSKGDVSGDSQVIFTAIQEQMPKLIRQ